MLGACHRYTLAFVALVAASCGDGDGGNKAPIFENLAVTTDEDTPITRTLDISDPNKDPLTITFGEAAHGTVTRVGADMFTYTPEADYNGADSFQVTVSDGELETTGTVNITVTPVNDAPVAHPDSFATGEDVPHTAEASALLANDTDVDGDTLTIESVGNATHGTVALVGGNVVFTPALHYTGMAEYRYTVTDGQATANATVTIMVGVPNDPPVAVDDVATTPEDVPLVISGATLVANDTDPEGQTLTVTAVSNAVNGTVTLAGGTVTFTPAANFHGAASFKYTVSDGKLTDIGNVAVTVTSVNDAPTALNDAVVTMEDVPVLITQAKMLANDFDVDGDAITVTGASTPVNGTITFSNGDVTFTPTPNFFGVGSFIYTVSDGMATSTAMVTITVVAVNDAPVAGDDAFTTPEDTNLVIPTATLLANDTDVDNAVLTVTAVGNAVNGTVTLAGNNVTFKPTPNFHGAASFTYTVSDGALTATGNVAVTVTPVNDAPVAVDDAATTPEDVAITVTPATMLANDTDVDGDPLTVTAASSPVNGTIAFSGGNVTFTPTANYHGTGSFVYTVSDGVATATAKVVITITPVNDAPVAIDDVRTTAEDTPLVITSASLLANDIDIDGDTLQLTSVLNAANGTVTRDGATGDITFTPAANFNGSASFDYVVSDGSVTDTGTVTVVVTPVNDAPVAVDDLVATSFETAVNIPSAQLLANDTDVDSETLTITAVENATNGTVTLSSDGLMVTFTPDDGFSGNAGFEYIVSDGELTDTGAVTVAVNAGGAKTILSYAFRAADNPELETDVTATITGTNIAATVPFGTDVTDLVATFVTTGTSVSIGSTVQVSGVTSNDFTAPLTYRVTASDSTFQDYTVTITEAPSTTKDITSFAFLQASNAALPGDINGVITGTNIAVTVPTGTDVTALVASFTHTGSAVEVGTTTQVSGATPNDFTSPVTYKVIAADDSTQTYTVTVTIAVDPNADNKDLTSFELLAANNPSLTADVIATIDGTDITATLPAGADLTALVATFTHTGASVTVGGTVQTSDETANDFTSPVTYTVKATNNSTKSYTVTLATLAIACETLPNPDHGTVTQSNGGIAPSTATYTCDPGYVLIGSATRSCTAGTYDGTAPTCEIESSCGNGNLDTGEQCDDGNLVNGDGCSSTCTFERLTVFTFTSAGGSEATFAADNPIHAGLASTPTMSRGPGVTASAASNAFGATSWATSFDANDYFTFTVSPATGSSLHLYRFIFSEQRSNSGPVTYAVRSSLDNYAADLATGTTATSFAAHTIALPTQFRTVTVPVQFRIFAFGSTAQAGSFRIDNVEVTGGASQ